MSHPMTAGPSPARPSHTPKRDATGYGRLVRDGHYEQAPSGLWGKYDHVRRIWEDQVTRFAIRGALDEHVRQARQAGRGLRVIDLGCGSGEGWDLLCKVPVGAQAGGGRYVLGPDDLAAYHGIDLCPDMVAACCASFQDRPAICAGSSPSTSITTATDHSPTSPMMACADWFRQHSIISPAR